jgi:predicted HAD superfamily Cof-like phosphohydrolase
MRSTLEQVKEFHEAFKHPVKDTPDLGNRGLNQLRIELLMEETFELHAAMKRGDVKEAFDALLDLQYVLDGAFLALGYWRAKDDGFREVHSSNMSKLENGKPVYRADGKVLKGSNFRAPDLHPILGKLFQ